MSCPLKNNNIEIDFYTPGYYNEINKIDIKLYTNILSYLYDNDNIKNKKFIIISNLTPNIFSITFKNIKVDILHDQLLYNNINHNDNHVIIINPMKLNSNWKFFSMVFTQYISINRKSLIVYIPGININRIIVNRNQINEINTFQKFQNSVATIYGNTLDNTITILNKLDNIINIFSKRVDKNEILQMLNYDGFSNYQYDDIDNIIKSIRIISLINQSYNTDEEINLYLISKIFIIFNFEIKYIISNNFKQLLFTYNNNHLIQFIIDNFTINQGISDYYSNMFFKPNALR